MERQRVDRQNMAKFKRQNLQIVCLALALDEFRQRLSKTQLPQLNLDLDFPCRNGTENQIIRSVLQCDIRLIGEPFRLVRPPNKDVRVEEQLHFWPIQNSFGTGSSKSSLVQIVPRLSPGIRRFSGGMATSRATGFPFSVITTSAPSHDWATRSDNWLLASSILTVRVIASYPFPK